MKWKYIIISILIITIVSGLLIIKSTRFEILNVNQFKQELNSSKIIQNENIKGHYNEISKEMIIKDDLDNKELIKVKLETPLSVGVFPGKQRKVAEFTLKRINYKDKILNQIDLYYKNNINENKERNITYKYLTYYNETIEDYNRKCDVIGRLENGSDETKCYLIENGSHNIEKEQWNDFIDDKELPSETRIGIFADVYPGDNVEWVQDFAGIKADQWASWNESFNIGLTTYHEFNKSYNLVSIGNRDLTIKTGTPVNGSVNGVIGKGGKTNSTAQWKINNLTASPSATSWTLNYWFNSSANSEKQYWRVGLGDGPAGNNYCYFRETVSGKEYCSFNAQILNFGGFETSNRWYMITFVGNSSGVSGFFNGTYYDYAPFTSLNGYTFIFANTTGYDGYFDEMGYWNRSLTVAEISDLYNNGAGISYNSTSWITSTCTYPGSGNWNINCADNCLFNTNATIEGNISMYGTGRLTLNASWRYNSTNQFVKKQSGCDYRIIGGIGAGDGGGECQYCSP